MIFRFAFQIIAPFEPNSRSKIKTKSCRSYNIQAVADWQARVALLAEAVEQERGHWDRIAMCGIVPANFSASVSDIGKYVVPVEGANGTISFVLVAEVDLTLQQYIRSCAIVEAIGSDGRPHVSVKIS